MQAHNVHVVKLDDSVVLGRDGYPYGSGKVICNLASSAWRRGDMNYTVLRVLGPAFTEIIELASETQTQVTQP